MSGKPIARDEQNPPCALEILGCDFDRIIIPCLSTGRARSGDLWEVSATRTFSLPQPGFDIQGGVTFNNFNYACSSPWIMSQLSAPGSDILISQRRTMRGVRSRFVRQYGSAIALFGTTTLRNSFSLPLVTFQLPTHFPLS